MTILKGASSTTRALGALLVLAIPASCASEAASPSSAAAGGGAVVIAASLHDTSAPLRDLTPGPAHAGRRPVPEPELPAPSPAGRAVDPIAQRAVGAAAAPAVLVNVEGLGAGLPAGTYAYPSDTVSAVGATQVVELVNESLAVFDKQGTLVYGPKPTNTIWSGFGGPCETYDEGDAKVRYDALAGRWVVSQLLSSLVISGGPNGVCYAVSATSDATGSWHRYFFPFNSTTDSPMLGVWSDAYYVTINGLLANDGNLASPVCALDRASMLTGAAATQQCFSTNAQGPMPIPGDLDGTTAPPAGEPNLVIQQTDTGTASQLNVWKVHVDWTTPANSSITALAPLPVAASTLPGNLVPQPGTTQGVTPNCTTYRFAYRNLGDHESLVLSNETTSGGLAELRWYELRLASGSPTVYQQGTYAPADGVQRFCSSAAMDKAGNIALGYSVGSSTIYPGIRFTGRLAGDALGQMTQGEGTIVNGGGAQTGTARWGDYSSMSVDPVDGCTFWYSDQYIGENTATGWRTRLASFQLPGCGGGTTSPIVNGGFETGNLSGWTAAGTTSVGGSAHGGSYAAVVGSTSATNGDSSITQSFTAPSGGGTLSFWYDVHCPDTVSYDWATATLTDTTAGTTTTVLAKTCTNTNTWKQVSATLTGGHAYTLKLVSHDDNYAGDATYTQYDDVTFTAGTQPPPNPIVNGGFETGSLSGWTSAGTASVGGSAHGGSYAAVVGSTSATNGDSSVAQTFTAPSTGGTLSFWYAVHCPDTVSYDWATASLKDVTANTTTTLLAKTCTNTGAWSQVSKALVAGHQYTLTLVSHDDDYAGDPTYTQYDDVTVQ